MTATSKKEADLLLRSFLEHADEAECGRLLEEIICHHARPIVRRVIASKLNVRSGRCDIVEWQEQEDITEEVVVQLVRHLGNMRDAGQSTFESFENYVATVAHNACSGYLRRKYPERSRLKYKLRYILSHHEQYEIWRSNEREWLCGLAAWRNQPQSRVSSARLRQFQSDRRFVSFAGYGKGARELLRLVASLFEFAGGPVAFEEAVDFLTEATGVAGAAAEPNDLLIEPTRNLWAETEAIVTDRIDRAAYLKSLWQQIRELPPEQSAALLLNLKDGDGSDITAIFVSAGITTISEVADVLSISLDEFLEVWKKLPLTDEQIAARLGVSARQVGSLRQAGRRRLSRRMELYERQKNSKPNSSGNKRAM